MKSLGRVLGRLFAREHLPASPTVLPVSRAGPIARKEHDHRLAEKTPDNTAHIRIRSEEEQRALIAHIQQDEGLHPPDNSCEWPETLLRRWYADGGVMTLDALSKEDPCSATRKLIDEVGANLPVKELELLDLGKNVSLLGAIHQNDEEAISLLFAQLANHHCVACTLGAGTDVITNVLEEGERAWPSMRPGEVRGEDGATVAGLSPSGARRGDRYILCGELGDPQAWPALNAADSMIGTVGSSLASKLNDGAVEGIDFRLVKRSDTFFACFPGTGLGYGSHFDGGTATSTAEITSILYTSPDWVPEHGGCLHMLDEESGCWWAVPPRADTFVMFRSDRVLHKVEPCFVTRYALTAFMQSGYSPMELEQAMLAARLGGDFA